jgi:hypothetical protein
MRTFLATAVFSGTFFFATASWAATPESAKPPTTLEPIKGDVWINHGKGFVKVSEQIEAKVGDSVMVSPGGFAKVTYADKCEAKVKPGAVMTIAPLSPCASGSLAADLSPMVYKAAPAAAPPPTYAWWPWVFVAGGIGFIACEAANGCFQSSVPGSP